MGTTPAARAPGRRLPPRQGSNQTGDRKRRRGGGWSNASHSELCSTAFWGTTGARTSTTVSNQVSARSSAPTMPSARSGEHLPHPALESLPPLACSLPNTVLIRCLPPPRRRGARGALAAARPDPPPLAAAAPLAADVRCTAGSNARPSGLGLLACAWVQHNKRLVSGSRAA